MTRLVYNKQKSLSIFESLLLFFSVVVLLTLTASIRKPQGRNPAGRIIGAPSHSNSILSLSTHTSDTIYESNSVINTVRSSITYASTTIQETDNEAKPIHRDDEPEYITDLSSYQNAAAYPIQTLKDLSAAYDMDFERMQADKDRKQADIDRKQADKDRAQAEIDRETADRDRAVAEKDREEADRLRKLADIDRARADLDRLKADEDRKQLEKERQTIKI